LPRTLEEQFGVKLQTRKRIDSQSDRNSTYNIAGINTSLYMCYLNVPMLIQYLLLQHICQNFANPETAAVSVVWPASY